MQFSPNIANGVNKRQQAGLKRAAVSEQVLNVVSLLRLALKSHESGTTHRETTAGPVVQSDVIWLFSNVLGYLVAL